VLPSDQFRLSRPAHQLGIRPPTDPPGEIPSHAHHSACLPRSDARVRTRFRDHLVTHSPAPRLSTMPPCIASHATSPLSAHPSPTRRALANARTIPASAASRATSFHAMK